MESALGGTFSFPEIPLHIMSYETASLLTLTSIAYHGRKGSVICALHPVSLIKVITIGRLLITCLSGHPQKIVPRFLYAKSSDAMLVHREFEYLLDMPSQATIEALVHNIPSMLVVKTLTEALFAEVSWRYGIPEDWFRGPRLQIGRIYKL